jgi:hypothetical protein
MINTKISWVRREMKQKKKCCDFMSGDQKVPALTLHPPMEREAKGGYLMRRGRVYLHGGTSGKRLSFDGLRTVVVSRS